MSVYFIDMPKDKDDSYQSFRYPAGELQVRILESEFEAIEQAEKIVIEATIMDGNPMELLLMIDAIVALNLKASLFLILPYLPYARADRRFIKGDCSGLSVFGRAIDLWSVNKIVTFDVHSKVSSLDLCDLKNVEPYPILSQVMMNYEEKPTILLPDKGSVDRYDLQNPVFENCQVEICDKIRDSKTGKLSGFKVPHIHSSRALIIDDLCDGGGTFVGTAEVVKEQQSNVILDLYVSHGIFSQGFEKLKKYFNHIHTTDSFPGLWQSKVFSGDLVTVYPIGGLLKGSVLSVSEIFEQVHD